MKNLLKNTIFMDLLLKNCFHSNQCLAKMKKTVSICRNKINIASTKRKGPLPMAKTKDLFQLYFHEGTFPLLPVEEILEKLKQNDFH